MDRRRWISAAGALLGVHAAPATVRTALAQAGGRVHKLGILLLGEPRPAGAPPVDLGRVGGTLRVFLDRLEARGYAVGRNLAVELRTGGYGEFASLASELVQRKVDVIFTVGTKASRIVLGAARGTPLVIYSCDPFEHVIQLARPQGNLTGTTCMSAELTPKRMEMLKELLPRATRVAYLADLEDTPAALRSAQEAAAALGLKLHPIAYRSRDRLSEALEEAARQQADALHVFPDPILVAERQQLADLALVYNLPTVHAFPEFAEAGGLLAYGASNAEIFAALADQVALVLSGRKPGEVPFQRATRFQLVINVKTATALGLTVPRVLLARADRLIE